MLLGALAILGALVLAIPATSATPATGGPSAADDGVTVVLFHGEGCPHCAAEQAFLDELSATHPQLRVEEHEVWYDQQGQELLIATAERLGFEPTGVPVTIIDDRVWIGFDTTTAQEITAAVEAGGATVPTPEEVATTAV